MRQRLRRTSDAMDEFYPMDGSSDTQMDSYSRFLDSDSSEGSDSTNTQALDLGGNTTAQRAEKGTNAADQLGTAGMASGNPYAMAAGAALKVVGQAKARKDQKEQQKVNNEIARRNRVMQAMGQLGQGFGSIG